MRRVLLASVLVLSAQVALAQDAVPPTPPEVAATTVVPLRPAPVQRRARAPVSLKPLPLVVAKLPAQVPPPRQPGLQAGARAPVPNRNLDAPLVIPQDRTSLGPSIINRSLPGRGQAADGAPDILEDKLFRPAPGARLNVPFSF